MLENVRASIHHDLPPVGEMGDDAHSRMDFEWNRFPRDHAVPIHREDDLLADGPGNSLELTQPELHRGRRSAKEDW